MIKTIAEHRSIRKFKSIPIPQDILNQALLAATRASTTGGMQVYSIIVTTQQELVAQLSPCHFNQPSVIESGTVVTFCADVNRFSKWCRQREAKPGYDNFMWFINGAIDALLASQNFALEAENQGLGICYLGTTTFTADKIIDILKLPVGVVPITTIVVGYPDQNPPLTPRLPLEAVVHYQQYNDYSTEQIDQLYYETEHSEFTANLLAINELPNLARIFTERRYKEEESLHFSNVYFEVLRKQGFIK